MEAGNESVRRKQLQPPQVDEAGLADFLSTQPDVVAAYLFGSLAVCRRGNSGGLLPTILHKTCQ